MYSTLLAPIDVSVTEICERVLQRAQFHITNSECRLHLLGVAASNATEQELDELRGSLMEFVESHVAAEDNRITLHVKQGLPSDSALTLAKEIGAELIIIGSHRGGQSQLGRPTLGSTAAKIASQTECDLYIVKAQD